MAELYDVQSILDYRVLTEGYVAWGRSGAPNPFFEFYTNMSTPAEPPDEGEPPLTGEGGAAVTESADGSTTTAPGLPQYPTDQVEFIKLGRVKDPAPINFRGQPARVMQPTGKEKASLAMLNSFNVISLSMGVLQMLREPDQHILQQRGRTEISQQFEDFATKHRMLKQVYVAKNFLGGAVYFDGGGEILESSAGAEIVVETGVPAINQGQLDKADFGTGTGNIIALPWDNAAAKIFTQLDDLYEVTEYQNTEPLRHVWLHRSNRKWLRDNTEILAFYSAGQERLDRDLMSDTFELNGWMFHFYAGTYKAADGTTKPFIPKDKAIVTPDPGQWLAQGVGLQLIPTSLDIQNSVQDVVSGWQEHWGDFAYTLADHNPASINMYMGFNWLFGFRNPASVFSPTVDF